MHPIEETVRIRLCPKSAGDLLFSKQVLPDRARGGIFRNFSGHRTPPRVERFLCDKSLRLFLQA